MSLKVALPPHQHTFTPIHPFSPSSPASKPASHRRIMAAICHEPPLGHRSDFRGFSAGPHQLTPPRRLRKSPSTDHSRTPTETTFHATATSGLRTIHRSEADASAATEDYPRHLQDGREWCGGGGRRDKPPSPFRISTLSRRLSCNTTSDLPEYRPLPRLRRENAFKITSDDAEDEFLYRAGLSCQDNTLSDDLDSCTTQFPDFVGCDDTFQ